MTIVPITSSDLKATEVSFFSALCSDDYRYLEFQMDVYVQVGHIARKLLNASEANGFRNILCPSSYQVGQDTSRLSQVVLQ